MSSATAQKGKQLLNTVKQYWKNPAAGNYMPYKEIVEVGVAGLGVHWTTTLAATIGLSASNFLVGASIGLQPLDLQIMLVIANLVGIPLGFFRGWLFDNHHMKGGKFLPILLRTPIPIVAISAIFVWLPYEHWEYLTKAVVVWFMFMILQFFLCLFMDGWAFFQQVVTPNSQERANAMSIFQIIYSLAPTITNLVIPTIAAYTFGNDNIWTYRVIYPGFTVVGLVVLLIFLPKLKERIILPKQKMQYVSIMDSLREVAKNKYFWIINSALWLGFLEGAYGAILGWSFVYANGGANEKYLGLANTIIGNAALWSMIVCPILIKKMGKRNLLIVHNTINIFLFVLLAFVYKSIWGVCVIFYLNSFVNTLQNIYTPNIQADMRDYHQWKTGVRVDGLFGSLGVIGTVIGLFTGFVVPALQEHMGLHDDYSVLSDDILRNNLFEALIICSIIGSILNLIPYLFYDLTESKHHGYVNVLKIRAMFEDYGNGDLDNAELIDAMNIIEDAKHLNAQDKKKIDKSALRAAKKLPHKTPEQKQQRAAAIAAEKEKISAQKQLNERLDGLPIVIEELHKFETRRYQLQLAHAQMILSRGELSPYTDWKDVRQHAKQLPKKTKEEREIRADAFNFARQMKTSYQLLLKHGTEHLTVPNEAVLEELETRESHSMAQQLRQKQELKAYTKGVSVYHRITTPYTEAKMLLIQAENYTHLAEIEALYRAAKEEAAQPVH